MNPTNPYQSPHQPALQGSPVLAFSVIGGLVVVGLLSCLAALSWLFVSVGEDIPMQRHPVVHPSSQSGHEPD